MNEKAYVTMQKGVMWLIALMIVGIVTLAISGRPVPPTMEVITATLLAYLAGNKVAESRQLPDEPKEPKRE